MPQIALVTALLLIIEGLFGYFGADVESRSPTALIPLFVGLPIGLSGLLALKESIRKHAMHAAVTFGLLGALAALGKSVQNGITLASGEELNTRAAILVLVMAIICVVFVGLCVRSFIAARKRQQAAESGE